MACRDSFPSSRGEKYPNPKSGRDLVLDKPECVTSCWGAEIRPKFFGRFFFKFLSLIPDSANQPYGRL